MKMTNYYYDGSKEEYNNENCILTSLAHDFIRQKRGVKGLRIKVERSYYSACEYTVTVYDNGNKTVYENV